MHATQHGRHKCLLQGITQFPSESIYCNSSSETFCVPYQLDHSADRSKVGTPQQQAFRLGTIDSYLVVHAAVEASSSHISWLSVTVACTIAHRSLTCLTHVAVWSRLCASIIGQAMSLYMGMRIVYITFCPRVTYWHDSSHTVKEQPQLASVKKWRMCGCDRTGAMQCNVQEAALFVQPCQSRQIHSSCQVTGSAAAVLL